MRIAILTIRWGPSVILTGEITSLRPLRNSSEKGFHNLLTAGRSAAGEGYAWDVLRVIPPAIISGQAAGVACVHALEEEKPIWDGYCLTSQEELSQENVTIHFDDADAAGVQRGYPRKQRLIYYTNR
ncbi:MAG: FAD-dependent oxidoreductase [Clostridia bacterium]